MISSFLGSLFVCVCRLLRGTSSDFGTVFVVRLFGFWMLSIAVLVVMVVLSLRYRRSWAAFAWRPLVMRLRRPTGLPVELNRGVQVSLRLVSLDVASLLATVAVRMLTCPLMLLCLTFRVFRTVLALGLMSSPSDTLVVLGQQLVRDSGRARTVWHGCLVVWRCPLP